MSEPLSKHRTAKALMSTFMINIFGRVALGP